MRCEIPCLSSIFLLLKPSLICQCNEGAVVAKWWRSWLVEQEVRGSIPRLAIWISEIGNLLLPSRDMAEINDHPNQRQCNEFSSFLFSRVRDHPGSSRLLHMQCSYASNHPRLDHMQSNAAVNQDSTTTYWKQIWLNSTETMQLKVQYSLWQAPTLSFSQEQMKNMNDVFVRNCAFFCQYNWQKQVLCHDSS